QELLRGVRVALHGFVSVWAIPEMEELPMSVFGNAAVLPIVVQNRRRGAALDSLAHLGFPSCSTQASGGLGQSTDGHGLHLSNPALRRPSLKGHVQLGDSSLIGFAAKGPGKQSPLCAQEE